MSLALPEYSLLEDTVAPLELPMSLAEIHGGLCAYLCAGTEDKGESYIRALMPKQKNEAKRAAVLALFDIYAISEEQMSSIDFSFELLLPRDDSPLAMRAQAFSEWCQGFIQGLHMANFDASQLQEEDSQEALQHLVEFAELDYESLSVSEEDEQSLMEVCEFTRMAVLRIHTDLIEQGTPKGKTKDSAH